MRWWALVLCLMVASPAASLNGRPEIVVVIDDDVTTQAMGAYGETDLVKPARTTTNFDTLASQGQLYTNFTTESACSPTRRNLHYGMNPLQHGAGRPVGPSDTDTLYPWMQRLSIVSAMQAEGYRVVHVGKFHVGQHGEDAVIGGGHTTSASAMGFDEVHAYIQSGSTASPLAENPPGTAPYYHYNWLETNAATGALSVNSGYSTDVITAAAVSVLQDLDPRPLLLLISYAAPHIPHNPPPGEVGVCGALASGTYEDCYGPAIDYIDTSFGLILAEMLWSEDTVIKLSDNGRPAEAGATQLCPDETEMKSTPTPCGTRAPMAIRGVGVLAGSTVSQLVNIADLHDTLLEMAGASQYGAESISFFDCFANPTTCTTRDVGYAVRFKPNGLPAPMYDDGVFDEFNFHLLTVVGANLYGMRRDYVANDIGSFTDIVWDLGSPTIIDTAKRYGQVEIPIPAGDSLTAHGIMTDEIDRLIAGRWQGPPNNPVGVTVTGVEH